MYASGVLGVVWSLGGIEGGMGKDEMGMKRDKEGRSEDEERLKLGWENEKGDKSG